MTFSRFLANFSDNGESRSNANFVPKLLSTQPNLRKRNVSGIPKSAASFKSTWKTSIHRSPLIAGSSNQSTVVAPSNASTSSVSGNESPANRSSNVLATSDVANHTIQALPGTSIFIASPSIASLESTLSANTMSSSSISRPASPADGRSDPQISSVTVSTIHQTNLTNSSIEVICRICLEQCPLHQTEEMDSDRRLISPCRCRGQSKYVHLSCLREWLRISRTDRCQVCQTRMRNVRVCTPNFFHWFLHEFGHLLMLFMFLTPLIFDVAVSIYYMDSECHTMSLPAIFFYEPTPRSSLSSGASYATGLNQTQVYPSFWTRATSNRPKTHFEPKKSQMSIQLSLYNLYLLRLQLQLLGLVCSVSGIPCTLLLSAPAFYFFISFCRLRMRLFQRQHRQLILPNARDWRN